MAQSQSNTKGNPAATRMTNANLKAKRDRSWTRGQRRKEERRKEQARREAKNRELRAQGLPTPWEEAKAKARERRRG
jgi:hypothetical protein